jgi:putative transposase
MPRRPRNHELQSAIALLRAELRLGRREIERLRVEVGILRDAAEPLIHQAPARERFAFIHARRERYSVNRLCQVLVADRCNYHAWTRAQARREERGYDDRQLAQLVLEIHTAHPAYGAVRVSRELKRQGVEVGTRRVARLMREHGLTGVTRRRRRNLTRPDKGAAAVPDLICRQFSAPMPGLKMIGDISCFRTGEGWIYLATVLDLCSRELIGYAIAPHMRASLAVDAITAAHGTGLVAGNAIMHTDRGSQYHSRAYRNALRRLEIRPSTSRIGSCLDGAAAESFFATIKTEIGADFWPDRASARRDIESWITDYNKRRLHSTLDYQTPTATRLTWQQRMETAF